MKQATAHSSNANNNNNSKHSAGSGGAGNTLEAPLPHRFKIYTDSSDSHESDENERKDWMLVSQKKKNSDESTDSNEEVDHEARRIRLQHSLMTGSLPIAHPDRDLVLHPKRLFERGLPKTSNASTPIDGVQTDESKSVSGEVDDDSASDHSHELFSAALDDLNSYTVVRDEKDQQAFRNELRTAERSGLTPEEEALISLTICDEDMAALHGMGIHYPLGLDESTQEATEFLGNDRDTTTPFDPGDLWNGMIRVIQYFVKPTQKSITDLRSHAEKVYKEWSPVLHSSKFQMAVALTFVAVFAASKIMDRDRVRNPMPIVRQLQNRKVSEETLEKVFAALAAHKHPTNPPFY